ncbi:mucin-22 [Eurosta solidaginis]|uniref:mucin-22 n=1 Tax=Eurosta solidaginis TaxID=178769 RepID=UPI0035315E43
MLTRHALNTLTRSLAAALILCTLIQAAPSGVAIAGDEGQPTATTSEISTDHANSWPHALATTDAAYVAESYANAAEVDPANELVPTTLPITSADMALAEMAAVLAELASTTAAEMKVKTTVEQEDKWVRRRAEEAKRRAVERVIANTVEAGEGEPIYEKDFLAITVYRSNFLNTIGVTKAPTTSATLSIAAAVTTTNASTEIFNGLVKAAAAANEILSAASNVATMAITNMTASDATTKSYEIMEEAKTTVKPIATTNNVGETTVDDAILTVMSDDGALPEQSAKWQPNKVAITSIPKEITTTITSMDAKANDQPDDTTNLGSAIEATESKTNIGNGANGDEFFHKSLENEYAKVSMTDVNFIEIPIIATIKDRTIESSKVMEELQNQTGLETAFPRTEEPFEYFATPGYTFNDEADNEAAESLQIITQETTTEATSPLKSDNEVGSETFNFYYASSIETQKPTTTPTAVNIERNATDKEIIEIAKNLIFDTTTPTSSTSATQSNENGKEAVEIEKAKVQELKLRTSNESKHKANADHESVASNANTVAVTDIGLTTTEPLETLIAVESEARAPNKIVFAVEEKPWSTVELAPFTTVTPASSTESSEELAHQEIAPEIAPTNGTTTKATESVVGEISSETLINPTFSATSYADAMRAAEALETKMEQEIAKSDEKIAPDTELSSKNEGEVTVPPRLMPSLQISTTTELPQTTAIMGTLEKETAATPAHKGVSESEEKIDAVMEHQPELVTTLEAIEIASFESTVPVAPESLAFKSTTNQVQITETREPVTEAITANDIDRSDAFDHTISVINVSLAPFTTTTNNPTITDQLTTAIFPTTNSNAATAGSDYTEIGQTASISSSRTTTPADSMLPTTLNRNKATTNAPAAMTLAKMPTNKGDSLISDTTTTSVAVVETTIPVFEAAGMETELNAITKTTPNKETTTTETVESEQPLYMHSPYVQQQRETSITELGSTVDTVNYETATTETQVVAGKETNNEAPKETDDVRQQYLYMRVLSEQQRDFESAESLKTREKETEDTSTTPAFTISDFPTFTGTKTTNFELDTTTSEPEATTITYTAEPETTNITITPTTIPLEPYKSITKTTWETETTTPAEPETTTTTTTTPAEPETTTTTTTTPAEPETTTTTTTTTAAQETTTTTTTTAVPETTTTTTPVPETTTTTTLSPMSLIIAEHEARTLDKTPSRVRRIINDDGVEVLSGYSIVHRIHAAAWAALAEEA